MPDVDAMTVPGQSLFVATTNLRSDIAAAFAYFAGQAVRAGFRDIGTEYMAHAVAMIDRLETEGRGDMSAQLVKAARDLEAHGLREAVFKRASELAEVG